jgi:hypothetical protein
MEEIADKNKRSKRKNITKDKTSENSTHCCNPLWWEQESEADQQANTA